MTFHDPSKIPLFKFHDFSWKDLTFKKSNYMTFDDPWQPCKQNHNIQTSKAPLNSQVQGTSLFKYARKVQSWIFFVCPDTQ